MGHRWARWAFQLGLHIQGNGFAVAIFFSSVIFNLCSADAGVSMGYFPVCDGPAEDLFADHLSFHQPALFYKLVQE